jgi:hypothetical protein
MLDYRIGYFVCGLILLAVWLVCWLVRKDLRKEILYGSLMSLPFGVTEFFFVPEYWNPPALFDLINRIGFGIESFMFSFFGAGIATVVYEILFHKNLRKKLAHTKKTPLLIRFLPYWVFTLGFIAGEIVFPTYSIFNLIISGFLTISTTALLRRDLIPQLAASGLIFAVLYFGLFTFYNQLFPDYISLVYTLPNLIGIFVLGIPIEEILFAISLGAAWSTMYEFSFQYQTVAKPRRK